MDNAELSTNHYPLMKDSGVEWLGRIPAGWKIKKLKYLVNINEEVLPETANKSFPIKYVDISNVKAGVGILSMEELSFSSAPSRARRIVRDGDVIVSTVRTYLRSIAKISNPPDNLIVSTGFAVIRPRRLNSDYTGYMFYSENLIGEIVSRSTGVSYPAINASEIGNIPVPIPSIKEQTAIASFLDSKATEIDALIAQKERLLELYEEEKTAIINHAVTKGLEPNATLKDSGLEWLGEIPVGWKLKNLKYVAKHGLQNGIFKKAADFGSGIRLINVGDIYAHNFLIDENALERVACTASEVTKYGVNTGDIFFVRSSLKREGIAKTACLEGRNEAIVFECHLIKITPKDIAHQYLNYYLNSDLLRHKLISLSITTTMSTISQDAIGSLEIVIPSSKEQIAIVQYIKTETARINAKIAKTQRIIELQKEYRTALISEVVTGKIKVPELPTQEASA